MVSSCAFACQSYALLSRQEESVVRSRARPGVQSSRVLSPSESSDSGTKQTVGRKRLATCSIHHHPRVGKKEQQLAAPQASQKQIAAAKTASAVAADRAIRFGTQPQATSPTEPKPLRERPPRDVPRQQASLCSNCGRVWRSSCSTSMHVDDSAAYS